VGDRDGDTALALFGALSIWSKGVKALPGMRSERTLVIAAVRVVLPWSM